MSQRLVPFSQRRVWFVADTIPVKMLMFIDCLARSHCEDVFKKCLPVGLKAPTFPLATDITRHANIAMAVVTLLAGSSDPCAKLAENIALDATPVRRAWGKPSLYACMRILSTIGGPSPCCCSMGASSGGQQGQAKILQHCSKIGGEKKHKKKKQHEEPRGPQHKDSRALVLYVGCLFFFLFQEQNIHIKK